MFHAKVSRDAATRVDAVLRSGWLGEGEIVREFEREFEQRLGLRNAVAVNSCSAALYLSLKCAGIGVGDEVITTAQTFVATPLAIVHAGSTPVFTDIDGDAGVIDPVDVERKVTQRTRAILPVHWGGYPCDLDAITEVARRNKLVVIEDAAHALGASYRKRMIGSISDFTCFSFGAIKQVNAGDGGMLLSRGKHYYERARRLRWFGIDREKRRPTLEGEPEWDITEAGFKFHMNNIAAAMGVEHLREIETTLEHRRRIATIYTRGLERLDGVRVVARDPSRVSAWWLFDIHVERRESFIRLLRENGIETSLVHRRVDTHSVFGSRTELPRLAQFEKSHLCLPIHSEVTEDDAEYVLSVIEQGW